MLLFKAQAWNDDEGTKYLSQSTIPLQKHTQTHGLCGICVGKGNTHAFASRDMSPAGCFSCVLLCISKTVMSLQHLEAVASGQVTPHMA